LYSKFESLGSALQYAYPEFNWDLDKFSFRGKKAEQRMLKTKIEDLLPGIEIIEEFQHPGLSWGMFVFRMSMLFRFLSYFFCFSFLLLLIGLVLLDRKNESSYRTGHLDSLPPHCNRISWYEIESSIGFDCN
jgi:hypothetical protein